MTSPPFRPRRLRDRAIAVGLALAVVAIGFVVYSSSDIANTSLHTTSPSNGPSGAWSAATIPSPTSNVPTALTQQWIAPTDPTLGAVASASGVVVTTNKTTMVARDAYTGVQRWSYSRSNRTLCAVGSGDVGPTDMGSSGSVAGIATVYEENGFCSQVTTFDPVTGARGDVRTSPNERQGALAFGGPYAGWLGPDRIEVWRFDLVRTIQYGNQINPPKAGQSRLGCTFTDLALASNQFATVEHCPAEGANARVVLNFDDPGSVADHPSGWDTFEHSIRVDIDTGAGAARIVGITADRVAVLVSAPTPAVVVYDASGQKTSTTPVDIPAAAIEAADSVKAPVKITPAVQTQDERYSFIGGHVLAISTPSVDAIAPKTSFGGGTVTSSSNISDVLKPSSSAPTTVTVIDLKLDWVAADALGLPATLGNRVLLPTKAGLSVFDASTGPGTTPGTVIKVDRGSYTGRVDATAIGKMIIEDRGSTVVGLE
ncbi:hypothetical protein SAMN04515671_4167 [Nakamurella panacisegetis]|uniref:PQQ-like domain-containing protein n=1 Tax=Nakamurella panacisegetis TaxID=1090615 RepID=A0A1H0SLK5_9ACTN|nr:hypothetical protein [Nakamurella panacisegetis]SDP42429.1 hypothetical protein SAMN04515671_4167 [Nakamurella panacisegetis]